MMYLSNTWKSSSGTYLIKLSSHALSSSTRSKRSPFITLGTEGQGANFDKISSYPSYITNAIDQYNRINGTAQGYDMEGNQLAMQLSPAHAIVSMGWESESKRLADAMIDCARRSPQGRDEREARASQNRMTSSNVDILSAPPGSPVNRIDNRYDPLHRRVLKQVSAWNATTGTWDLQSTTRFTYDG